LGGPAVGIGWLSAHKKKVHLSVAEIGFGHP